MTRRLAAFVIAVASAALVTTGAALIYPPLGFVVAGAALGGLLFVDIPDVPRRSRR